MLWAVVAAALAVVALFETDTLESGVLASGHDQLAFVLTFVMELLTLAAIPLALKLLWFKRVRADLVARRAPALLQWGALRLCLLGLPLLANTLLYYMFMQTAYGYMAIIFGLSLPFVYPSWKRCMSEVEPESAAPEAEEAS